MTRYRPEEQPEFRAVQRFMWMRGLVWFKGHFVTRQTLQGSVEFSEALELKQSASLEEILALNPDSAKASIKRFG